MLHAISYINFTGSGWLFLSHCIQWYHKALEILVNLVSGNGLLPGSTKPLPGLLLTNIGHEKLEHENNNIWMVEVVCCFCLNWSSDLTSSQINGWGLGAFLRWWPPSTMWVGPLILYGQHWECLNNPIFSNLGLCVFKLVPQNSAIPGYFLYILFNRYLFSLLSSDWFVIAVCGSISVRKLFNSFKSYCELILL